jgi:curved DNA-binding protein CbpA
MKDYYAILEVQPNASIEAIKDQYLLMVQAWHPDKFHSSASKAKATEKMKQLNEAYETLGNAGKRQKYDQHFKEHVQPQPEKETRQPARDPSAARDLTSPVCPVCQRDDLIKKVAVILETRDSPVLAQSLEAPPQPTYPVETPFVKRSGRRGELEHYRQQIKAYSEDLEHWKQVMELWNQLYYCERDGCVFVPGTASSAPLLEMTPYLYRLVDVQ